jgi:hypothetical protein
MHEQNGGCISLTARRPVIKIQIAPSKVHSVSFTAAVLQDLLVVAGDGISAD